MNLGIEIMPHVHLHTVRTDRFKSGCLSISLLRPLRQEEAAMNALLPSVLLRGCAACTDMRQISQALDSMYGAGLGPLVRKSGQIQTTGFYLSFLEERFALDGGKVLRPLLELLRSVLLEPVTAGGAFLSAYVEGEKQNLINTIEADLNDKRVYAARKMSKLLYEGSPCGISRLGEPEQIQAITPEGLFQHYREILRNSEILLFYCGMEQPETVAGLLRDTLSGIPRETPQPLSFAALTRRNVLRRAEEAMAVTQSKLALGFSTGCTSRDPGFVPMMVFHALYGAGATSKLFQNVRERMSLCYYASSSIYAASGAMAVSSGVEDCNYETAREEILRQLACCQAGEITKDELEAAQRAIRTGLEAIQDSPGQMEDFHSFGTLSGLPLSWEEYHRAVQDVTVEQVAEAAARVHLEAEFYLKGVGA